MKKNLHFVLALTLGLATTVSAQDWSVDSRTRVNSTEDATSTDQRVRTAVDFGGDAVSAHVELNSTATLGRVANEDFSLTVREAYATTNVMDFASVTAGRMALNFGSGRILGDNDWVNGNGNTWDGFLVGINNDFADIHVGYSTTKDAAQTVTGTGLFVDSNSYVYQADYALDLPAYEATMMYFNVAKDMGAMSFNFLYVDTKEDVSGTESTSMGLDATYAMDNGVNLSLGYYTNDDGTTEMDLTSLGASYAVNDDLTVMAGYDMYGENGFYLSSGSFGDGYGSGMNYSAFDAARGECTDLSFGGSYAMGDFMIGATMHTISADEDGAFEDISVMDLSLGYTLSDNSSVTMNYASTDESGDDETRTWISLNIGF